ncbi:glycosyltransferase family 2 protein [Cellulomonas xylanilytica]|uniref:glycosyltransferase family 2 protein n=1 Tax=Cellulomonas xylanilytica TaxID=233583 RepID=UPI001FE9C49F|nr:glycosyltransferase family A protein [Cellulomonas xylanilytica]
MSVIVTAFDQGELVAEAVESALDQTRVPDAVIVVDDGSTDAGSVAVIERLQEDARVRVLRQPNRGVGAARNAGIAAAAGTDVVAVLDGDDRLAPTFLERTVAVLEDDPGARAASSWLHAHGVIDAVVRPGGGSAVDFLHRNACPATAVVRRDAWRACGGYDEDMRSGFEDWDFFLSLVGDGGHVTVVPEPLVEYRTAPASANVRSMDSRLELYGRLVDKHRDVFERHLREVLLALEARAIDAAGRWEDLVAADPSLPVGEVTYGDGGMAAAVRIAVRRG